VVSGGSKGLGLAICKDLLTNGYPVATFSRSRTPELQGIDDQYPDRFYWESVDIADKDALSAFLKQVKGELGRVGYLINSAGVAIEGLLPMLGDDDVETMLRVNLHGSIMLARLCVKQMLVSGFGAIVNISSIVGRRGYKGVSVYSATKAALDGMTRSLSRELGSAGIRINAVAPGFMETEMTSQLTDKQKTSIIRQTPLNRLGTVDDIVSVVRFLLSDDAGFITGQTIVVDGGFTV
jgi:3-oxoacyl-[acyl-carrier protein] reductase